MYRLVVLLFLSFVSVNAIGCNKKNLDNTMVLLSQSHELYKSALMDEEEYNKLRNSKVSKNNYESDIKLINEQIISLEDYQSILDEANAYNIQNKMLLQKLKNKCQSKDLVSVNKTFSFVEEIEKSINSYLHDLSRMISAKEMTLHIGKQRYKPTK